jgi:hypothetical protein
MIVHSRINWLVLAHEFEVKIIFDYQIRKRSYEEHMVHIGFVGMVSSNIPGSFAKGVGTIGR